MYGRSSSPDVRSLADLCADRFGGATTAVIGCTKNLSRNVESFKPFDSSQTISAFSKRIGAALLGVRMSQHGWISEAKYRAFDRERDEELTTVGDRLRELISE